MFSFVALGVHEGMKPLVLAVAAPRLISPNVIYATRMMMHFGIIMVTVSSDGLN